MTLREKLVVLGVIVALTLTAVNAVVFATWRDQIIRLDAAVAALAENVAGLDAATKALVESDERHADGDCYALAAHIRIDAAFEGTESATPQYLTPKQILACNKFLENEIKVRNKQDSIIP